jgi:hypothetical protein
LFEQNNLIIKKSKEKLNNFLKKENLLVLCENYVNKLSLHLHKKLSENEINYACDHCHGTTNQQSVDLLSIL